MRLILGSDKARVDVAEDGNVIVVNFGLSEMVPLIKQAKGWVNWSRYLPSSSASSRRICFIDEVENGVHRTVMPDIWTGIAEVAERLDIQVFATTHSYECFEAAHKAFSKRATYDLDVISILQVGGRDWWQGAAARSHRGRHRRQHRPALNMNGDATVPISRRKWEGEPLIIFVEGYSDLVFYAEMMKHLGKHERCFIQNLGGKGKTQLEKEARLLLKPDNLAGLETVAVILDSDESADGAFDLARSALKNAVNVEIQKPNQSVASRLAEEARFGVFIVGDATAMGEVETLAWLAWKGRSGNQPLQDCISSVSRLRSKGGDQADSHDKTRIGALLAVLNDERSAPWSRCAGQDCSISGRQSSTACGSSWNRCEAFRVFVNHAAGCI